MYPLRLETVVGLVGEQLLYISGVWSVHIGRVEVGTVEYVLVDVRALAIEYTEEHLCREYTVRIVGVAQQLVWIDKLLEVLHVLVVGYLLCLKQSVVGVASPLIYTGLKQSNSEIVKSHLAIAAIIIVVIVIFFSHTNSLYRVSSLQALLGSIEVGQKMVVDNLLRRQQVVSLRLSRVVVRYNGCFRILTIHGTEETQQVEMQECTKGKQIALYQVLVNVWEHAFLFVYSLKDNIGIENSLISLLPNIVETALKG